MPSLLRFAESLHCAGLDVNRFTVSDPQPLNPLTCEPAQRSAAVQLGVWLSCFVNRAWPPFTRLPSCPGLCLEASARFCLPFSKHYFSDMKAAPSSEWEIMQLLRMCPHHFTPIKCLWVSW